MYYKFHIIKIIYLLVLVLQLQACHFSKKPRLFGIFSNPTSPSIDSTKKFILSNQDPLFTNEFGRRASFTIQLSKSPDSDVTIGPIVSLNPLEGIISSQSMITFTKDNFDQPQTVTIEGVADGVPDGNQKFFIKMGSVKTTDYSYSLLTIPDISVINTDKETPSIAASPTLGLSSNEGGQTVSIFVVLSTQPGADVIIPNFVSDSPSECSVSGSITFTYKNWDIPQEVTITGVDDDKFDGPKNCLISSSPSTSADTVYVNKTMPVVTVINVDNDTAGFTIIPITPAVTTESGGQAQISVVLNTLPTGTISVNGISTSDNTEGVISPINISFDSSNWNIPQVLTITGIDDSMNDGDINYTIVFPNSSNSNPADNGYNSLSLPSAGSFTNQDNDIKGFSITPLTPTTSITPITVTEGGASQAFQVSLTSIPCDSPGTPETCNPSSITLNFTNNNPSYYTINPSSLTFTPANWNINQPVTVTAVDDFIDKNDADFTLILNPIISTTDYSGIDLSDISIHVVNNDTAGFTINPSGGVTVNENDPGGVGLETTITIVLNSEPTSNVTLGPIISSDTLEVIIAPTIGGGNTPISNRTLVFTPTTNQAITNSDSDLDLINDTSTSGWNIPQTVRVRAVVDGTLDGTKLRSIQFGTRTTTDVKYANSTLTPTPNIPATNIDSGNPEILLQSISAVSFAENGTATITAQIVLATLPIGNVTISNIVSSDITEGVVIPNGGGASITNRTLIFTPTTNAAVTGTNTTTGGWNMPQTVTIQSVADGFDDGNIPFKIAFPPATGGIDYAGKLPTSSNGAYNGTTGELTLTNIDDDTAGFTFSPVTTLISPLVITEGAAAGTFTIRLNSDPCSTPLTLENCTSQAVTINLTNNDTSQYTISPSSLTFNAGTWNSPQTITVTPVNDDYDENNMDFLLVVNPISSSSDYNGLDPNDVNIRIVDNDTIGVTLTPNSGYSNITSSTGGFTEYNLALASSPFPGNTVTVTFSVPTAAPQEGKILGVDNTTPLDTRTFTFTSANWSTVTPFRVRGITGSGSVSTDFTMTATVTEAGALPPSGFTALTYNSYVGGTVTPQTITNYHIGAGKKIVMAGSTTSLSEASATPNYFLILLKQAPTASVTINFGIDSSYPCTLPVGSPSTQFTVSPASLTITPANWDQITTAIQISVTSVNDLVDDGNVACPLKITSTSSTDSFYNALVTPTDFDEPTITVTDNDTRGITFSGQNPLVGGLITSRSGASGTMQIQLNSQPMTDVNLTFSDIGGNATYSPATLTFTPLNYATNQTLTVTGNAVGGLSDNNYTIVATASSTETDTGITGSAIYDTFTSNQAAINRYLLYDLVPCTTAVVGTCSAVNPTGGTVPGTYTSTEASGKSYFAIALRARPSSNVTIPFSSSNTLEGTISPLNFTFTPANWNTLQVATISGVDDFFVDGNIGYNINFGAMSGDAAFTTTINSLTVTNSDNDTAGFILTPANDTGISELLLGKSFTIKLNSQPTANVSIPLSVNVPTAPDTGLIITSANPIVFTTANWNIPQTVTFTWTGDGTNLPVTRDHTVILGTASSLDSNYTIKPPDYSISIINSGL